MSMFPIASTVVGSGGAAAITFSSIPQTFTHLQMRINARLSSGASVSIFYAFNGDTSTANYATHRMAGDGSTMSSQGWAPGTFTPFTSGITGAGDTANVWGSGVINFLNYTSTTQNKTLNSLAGYDGNGSGQIYINSGVWLSNSAITSIVCTGQTSFLENSRIDLYGISNSNVTGA